MAPAVKIRVCDLNFHYRNRQVLHDVNLTIPSGSITAITGPSGSGKSTLLLALNRLWEEIDGCRVRGRVEIELDGRLQEIHSPALPARYVRRKVGLVFQQPNPLPMSIFRNIAFPLQLAGVRDRELLAQQVETALRKVRLWQELHNRLEDDGRSLSGGQQQRLCIARALVLQPEVLLLDEPTSSLDPETGQAIEELLLNLKNEMTLIVVSHYQDQVQRIADLRFTVREGRFTRLPAGRPRSRTGPAL